MRDRRSPVLLSRRACLLALAASFPRRGFAGARRTGRIAVLDWAILESVMALGVVPLAVAEPREYARQNSGPQLPAEVIDLGLRDQVNLELLARLRPDLILLPSWQTIDIPRLSRIAPTVGIDVYGASLPGLTMAGQALRTVAEHLGREYEAEMVMSQTQDVLAATRHLLAGRVAEPVYTISFLDEQHVWVYGAASLFHDTMIKVGLRNAWQGSGSDIIVTLGLDALAAVPDAWILFTEPLQEGLLDRIERNPLWSGLPARRAGKTAMIPPLLAFGGVLTARRFALEMGRILSGADQNHG